MASRASPSASGSCWRRCERSWTGHELPRPVAAGCSLWREGSRFTQTCSTPIKEKPAQVPPSLHSALLLPEGIARRMDAHHDSARIEELRLGCELTADGAWLVQQ